MILALVLRSLAFLGMLAPMGFAECPKRVDSVHGIVLTRLHPFTSSLYKATSIGLSEFRIMTKGGVPEKVSSTYLHALAPQDRISAKNTVSLHYAEPIAALDDLPQLKVWRSAVSAYLDGALVKEGTATKTPISTDEIAFGTCRYPVWVVEDRVDIGANDGTYFLQYYAPVLGLVVASIKMGPNGKPISGVQFDTIEVGQD